jgi:drug/metabolite transporter (DMT)-like permease
MRYVGSNNHMEVKGVGYALGAAALFGASTPAAKLLLRDLSPLMLSALLYLGAAIALSAYRFLVFESREAQSACSRSLSGRGVRKFPER